MAATLKGVKRSLPGEDGVGGKRVKLTDEVRTKAGIVAAAASSAKFRSDACQAMLESAVPGSLGAGLDQRDDLQERVVNIIGEVMEDLVAAADAGLKRKIDFVNDPSAAKADVEKELDLACDASVKADEKTTETERALEIAEGLLINARDKVKEAKKTLADARKSLKEKVEIRQLIESAYREHFVPLKLGEWKTRSEADVHMKFLKRIFQLFNFEDSLVAAFELAAVKMPASRRHFDDVTMTEAEREFGENQVKQSKETDELTPAVADAEKDEEAAIEEEKAAEKSVYDAGLAHGRAVTERGVAKAKEAAAKKALQDAPKAKADAQRQLDQFQREHDLTESSYKAFTWLKNRVAILEGRSRNSIAPKTVEKNWKNMTIDEKIGNNITEVLTLTPAQKVLTIGVGWDRTRGQDVDVDVSAIVFDDKGDHEVAAVYSLKKTAPGITHSGDNLTGEGEGDDETIQVRLDEVQADARQIYFCITVHTPKLSFADVSTCYCRLLDGRGNELHKMSTARMENEPGLVMARLYKDGAEQWHFQNIGLFCNGKNWFKLIPDLAKTRAYLSGR